MRCEKREKKWERMKKIWRVDFYIKWEYAYALITDSNGNSVTNTEFNIVVFYMK